MKRRLGSLVAAFALVVGLVPTVVLAAPIQTAALHPGQTVTFTQRVPINIVFLGYEQGQINTQAVMNQLPGAYEPVVRYPHSTASRVGIWGCTSTSITTRASPAPVLRIRFFPYLKNIGTPRDLTDYQAAYNDQEKNVLDVKDRVLVHRWTQRRRLAGPEPGHADERVYHRLCQLV